MREPSWGGWPAAGVPGSEDCGATGREPRCQRDGRVGRAWLPGWGLGYRVAQLSLCLGLRDFLGCRTFEC